MSDHKTYWSLHMQYKQYFRGMHPCAHFFLKAQGQNDYSVLHMYFLNLVVVVIVGGSEGTSTHVSSSCFYLCTFFTFQYFLIHNKHPFVLALFSFNALCPLCTGLIIHEGSSVYRIIKRWQAVNQQWKVLNYEKAKDLADPINSHDGRNSHVTDSIQRTSHHVRTILHQHCGYTILHILSQLRPNNLHRANQEVVMRVTTV